MASRWSVEQAAGLLGVSGRQVRGLIASGQLPAQRLGSAWLLDPEAVRARARQAAPAGRPFAPAFAWEVLWLLDALYSAPGPVDSGVWEQVADRRVRHRLRQVLAEPRPVGRWRQALAGRAVRAPVWVHPGVVDRLGEDPRLRLGGSAAAASYQVEAANPEPHRWYIDADDLSSVMRGHRLKHDDSSPYDLMVIPAAVPVHRRPHQGAPVPLVMSLVDLLDSSDARERHAAERRLAPLHLALGS